MMTPCTLACLSNIGDHLISLPAPNVKQMLRLRRTFRSLPGMVTLLSGDVKVEDGVLVQDQRLVDGEVQVAVGPVDEENWTE